MSQTAPPHGLPPRPPAPVTGPVGGAAEVKTEAPQDAGAFNALKMPNLVGRVRSSTVGRSSGTEVSPGPQLSAEAVAAILAEDREAIVRLIVSPALQSPLVQRMFAEFRRQEATQGLDILSRPDAPRSVVMDWADVTLLGSSLGYVPGNAQRGAPVSALLLALVHRRAKAVEHLTATYPMPSTSESEGVYSVCLAHVSGAVLTEAMDWGYVAVVDRLLRAEAGFFGRPFKKTCLPDICRDEYGDESNNKLLLRLCGGTRERLDLLQLILQLDATTSHVNANLDQAIHLASTRGHVSMVDALLRHGADASARNSFKQSPLHLAFRFGFANVAALLLKFGSDIDAVDAKGCQPLHYAVREHNRVCEYLERIARALQDTQVVEEEQAAVSVVPVMSLRNSPPVVAPPTSAPMTPDSERADAEHGEGEQEPAETRQRIRLSLAESVMSETTQEYDLHERDWGSLEDLLHNIELAKREGDEAMIRGIIDKVQFYQECRRALDAVISLAEESGADLEAEDAQGNPAFDTLAHSRWFQGNEEDWSKLLWNQPTNGFMDSAFKSKRTQLAIQREWNLKVRAVLYFRLCRWVIFIVTIMIVAIWETGRGQHYTRVYQSSVESALFGNKFGDQLNTFWDIGSADDMYGWMDSLFLPAVYPPPPPFRDGSLVPGDANFTGGAFMGSSVFIGRPRIRQLRVRLDTCPDVNHKLAAFRQAPCIPDYDRAVEEHRPFETGPYTWTWSDADVPGFVGWESTYAGSGYSIVLDKDVNKWNAVYPHMKNSSWVDLNTRAVLIEFSTYNPGLALFLVSRILFEFTASGLVIPEAYVEVLKLIPHMTSQDTSLLALQIWLGLLMLYFVFNECMQLSEAWPAKNIPHVRIHYPYLKFTGGVSTNDIHKKFLRKCCGCRRQVSPAGASVSVRSTRLSADIKSRAEAMLKYMPKHLNSVWDSMQVESDTLYVLRVGRSQLSVMWGRLVTPIEYRPYFFEVFNILDLALVGLYFVLWITFFMIISESNSIDWNDTTGFVNVYHLARVTRTRVYVMAVTVCLVWIKTLEYLRVNRALSTFILVIQGMFDKMSGFFTVLMFCLIAFAGLEYVAFGTTSDDISSIQLSLYRQFSASLGGLDWSRHLANNAVFGPLIVSAFAVFIVILLFNLLIAVMGQAIDELTAQADSYWCFTQFRMLQELELWHGEFDNLWNSVHRAANSIRRRVHVAA